MVTPNGESLQRGERCSVLLPVLFPTVVLRDFFPFLLDRWVPVLGAWVPVGGDSAHAPLWRFGVISPPKKKRKRVYLAPIPHGGGRGCPLLVFGSLGSGIPLVWGVGDLGVLWRRPCEMRVVWCI